MTSESAGIVREVIVELEEEYAWPLDRAISDVATILKVPRIEVFSAWLFGDRYGNPTI